MKVRNMDVGRVWDGMMCTCVNEEGGDGEGVFSEPSSLLSYTLRYVMFAELVTTRAEDKQCHTKTMKSKRSW